jgi:hypothetical protein
MSDTPRTDENVKMMIVGEWVHADFARELERAGRAAEDRIRWLATRDSSKRMVGETSEGYIGTYSFSLASVLRSYVDAFASDKEGLTLSAGSWNTLRKALVQAADALEGKK